MITKLRKLWKKNSHYPWENKKVYFDKKVEPELIDLIKKRDIEIVSSQKKADYIIIPEKYGAGKKYLPYYKLSKILDKEDKEIYKKQREKLLHDPLPNEKVFFIHDNGGRPFKVYLNRKQKYFTIYASPENPLDYVYLYTEKVMWQVPYEKVWIGDSKTNYTIRIKDKKYFLGNSILFRVKKTKYILVSSTIFSFLSKDPIKKFESPVGNSDVPYPYAITDNNIYMLAQILKLPLTFFPTGFQDPYNVLYESKEYNKKNFRKKHEIPIKIIRQRLY